VVIAGSGDSLVLLQKEFPALSFVALPGYSPRYPRNGSMVLAMATQLPRFLRVIRAEHRALENIIVEKKIDLIISDNRYGCSSRNVPSVFITHQSNILMPKRFGFLSGFVRRLNERLINGFTESWIPDFPENHSLAGDLVDFGTLRVRVPVKFIGWLSRFEYRGASHPRTDVLAILSGPEPQRTALEEIVVPQLKASGLKFTVVRGLPTLASIFNEDNIVNFLTASELQSCIESASLIIARSGYSTVMDMKALGKKVVFIPTPGQTEQEYLAKRLMQSRVAFSMPQDTFDLLTAIQESKNFSGFDPCGKNTLLAAAVKSVLAQARNRR
jgi:UDP-N-acetylglucosamine transferase subunit ALG13